jgi:hypothetical protein
LPQLHTAFVDGVALICLLESLAVSKVTTKYRKKATMRAQVCPLWARCDECMGEKQSTLSAAPAVAD